MKKISPSKGFFLLLAVAFITMFFSSFLLTRYSSVYKKTAQESAPISQESKGTVPVVRSTPTAIPSPTPKAETPSPSPQIVDHFIKPAEGTITKTHSTETLSYSKTTGDWSVHCGIDISGPQTEVKAGAMGVVTEVSQEGLLGPCVIIDHPGGLQSRYYGMEKVFVTLNQAVVTGDILGITGNASPGEEAEGTHLHFEVWKNNKPLNPEEFFE